MRLQALRPVWALPSRTISSSDLLKLPQADAAAVLELQLEAARDAQPLDRRRRKREDHRLADRLELLIEGA